VRRRATLLAVWIAGTVASMALAWTAVQVVGGEVTDDPVTGITAPAVAVDGGGATTTTTTTAAPPATTATTAPPPTTTTTAPPPPGGSQVFGTQGGSASVRCAGDAASVDWATPAPGYEAEIHEGGPQQVEIRFESEDHESRLEVVCRGGVPSAQTRDGEDDSGPG
jgi:hypothetical protein